MSNQPRPNQPSRKPSASASERNRALYVISVAAELAGVHAQTLRIYERKGLLAPARTSGGSRRYSDRDIAMLDRISQLTSEGLNLAGVKRVLELEETRGVAGTPAGRSLKPRQRPSWPRHTASTGVTWCRCRRPISCGGPVLGRPHPLEAAPKPPSRCHEPLEGPFREQEPARDGCALVGWLSDWHGDDSPTCARNGDRACGHPGEVSSAWLDRRRNAVGR